MNVYHLSQGLIASLDLFKQRGSTRRVLAVKTRSELSHTAGVQIYKVQIVPIAFIKNNEALFIFASITYSLS
jgi:hypothetical protein